MSGLLILAMIVGGIILVVITIGLTAIAVIRAVRTGGIRKKDRQTYDDETRMIQDIYNGLSKMEKRVEALETILIERKRKDG
jgi:phage shock protein B